MTTKPRTEAGRRLVERGSNNWSGEGWLEAFAANVAAVESEAQAAVVMSAPQMVQLLFEGARIAGPGGSRLWNHRDWQNKAKKLLGEETD